MGRPRKEQQELRHRWSVLNVTEAERRQILAHAAAAGLGASAYLVTRALQRPAAPRQDWQRLVRQQARLVELLDRIAAGFLHTASDRDAGRALLALIRIEAMISENRLDPGFDADDTGDAAC